MPNNLKLSEVVVDAVVAKLKNGMAARIAQINSEHTDFQIAVPANEQYFTGRIQTVPPSPAIFVMEGPARFAEEGSHSMIVEYDITVFILESAQTGPELGKRLQRQARAVIEVLYDDDPKEQLSGSAYRIFPYRTVPGRAFQPEGARDHWRAMYAIVFRATQEEL